MSTASIDYDHLGYLIRKQVAESPRASDYAMLGPFAEQAVKNVESTLQFTRYNRRTKKIEHFTIRMEEYESDVMHPMARGIYVADEREESGVES